MLEWIYWAQLSVRPVSKVGLKWAELCSFTKLDSAVADQVVLLALASGLAAPDSFLV